MSIQHFIDFLILLLPFLFMLFMQRKNTPEFDAVVFGIIILSGFGSAILTLIKLVTQ